MEMEENFDEIFDINPLLAEIYSNGSPGHQTSDHGSRNADAGKQLKTSFSWNSCHGQPEILSTEFTSSAPQLISFENSEFSSSFPTNSSSCNSSDLEMAKDYSLTSQIINFSSSSAKDDSAKKQYHDPANGTSHKARDPSRAQDHLIAERKRREHLSQLFITLSKVVPGLKKLDKVSLLEDAINYLKALQERVIVLEKEEIIKKSSLDARKDDCSLYNIESSINNNGTTSESAAPEISVRIANRHVLVKIWCKKQMGLMSRIPSEMEKINLNVIDMRIMPFGGAANDVTILAEMQSEFGGTAKKIGDHLQAIFLNPRAKFRQDNQHR